MSSANIKRVQEYEVNGQTLFDILNEKHQGFENGWMEEGSVVIFYFSPTKKLRDNPLKSPSMYKWKIEADKIKAVNGRAIEVTPELYKNPAIQD